MKQTTVEKSGRFKTPNTAGQERHPS